MVTYLAERYDERQYRGFDLAICDYRNVILGTLIREVSVNPISVPADVRLMFYRRIMERETKNKFSTLKEAKAIIDSCYRACSHSSAGASSKQLYNTR